jgi:hypothetical protein
VVAHHRRLFVLAHGILRDSHRAEDAWVLHGEMEVPTCGSRGLETVKVTLTFQDLRLEVRPREPTFLEQLEEDWFHRGSMLGDLVRGEIPRPEPRVLGCPPSGAGPGVDLAEPSTS